MLHLYHRDLRGPGLSSRDARRDAGDRIEPCDLMWKERERELDMRVVSGRTHGRVMSGL